jgi:hypothetical protein
MFNVANSICGLSMRIQVRPWVSAMEEPGEQDTVVFALIVTEPASQRVCVGGGGGAATPPPPPLASSVTMYAKTTVHCSPYFSIVFPLHSLSNLVYTYMYRTFTPTVCYLLPSFLVYS